MLSGEFRQFYAAWLRKADDYGDHELRELFDKFFTLYVLYNRVYAEATFELARTGKIRLANRNGFPDSRVAIHYVVQFLGARQLIQAIESDQSSSQALQKICKLIENGDFHILLEIASGAPRREEDLELLVSLRSANAGQRARAITRTIYAVRCSLFHGHKQFVGVQRELLIPVSAVLRRLIESIYAKLSSNN